MKTGEERKVGPSFVLRKKDDGVFGRYIEFSVRNSDFLIRWGEEVTVYHLLDNLTEEQTEAIHTWLAVVFSICQIVDADMTNAFLSMLDKYVDIRSKEPEKEREKSESEKTQDSEHGKE